MEPSVPKTKEQTIEFLEEYGITTTFSYDNNILHSICRSNGDPEIIECLFEEFEDTSIIVNQKNKFQQTPLHVVLKNSHPNVKTIELLLNHNASLEEENDKKLTPFLVSIEEDNMETITYLHSYATDNLGINLLNVSNSLGQTPLHVACERGKPRVVEYLLQHKADINAKDKDNQSPIFTVTRFNNMDCLDLLLKDENLDFFVKSNIKKLSVLHFICGQQKLKQLAYHAAKEIIEAAKNKGEHRKLLRIKDIEGKTPLFTTVKYNNPDIMNLLLEKNANINQRDAGGRTILFEAVLSKNVDILKKILSKTPNVNLQDRENRTALSMAVTGKLKTIERLLLEANAIPSIGERPLVIQKADVKDESLSKNEDINIFPKLPLKRSRPVDYSSIKILEQVGAGAFGRVFRAEWLGTVVAIKFFSHEDPKYKAKFTQEVNLLKSLNHPNIINCYGDCESPANEQCMLMEFLPLTLSSAISDRDLSDDDIISIMKGIASGMVYLHSKQIIHRDLKPSNILLSSDLTPKIADFGISRAFEGFGTMTSIGTPLYMAPEIINDKKYCESVDIYSYGLMFLQMYTRKKLYYELGDCSHWNIVFQVVKSKLRPLVPSSVPDDISDMIKKCWDHNPEQRPSFREIAEFLESKQSTPPSFIGFSPIDITVALSQSTIIQDND